MPQAIMNNYMKNAKGHLVPIDNIEPLDLERDRTVVKLAQEAKELQRYMKEVRQKLFESIANFVSESGEKHGVKLGGKKGNVTLYSFDQMFKIERQNSERIVFDETLLSAKALIDECLNEWTANAGANLRTIVTEAFETDKEGKINHTRIFKLCRLKIDDERWRKAVEIIGKSREVIGTASYIRVYERDEKGKYQLINLDIAKV